MCRARKAYGGAVAAFCDWCNREGVALERLTALTVSGYRSGLQGYRAVEAIGHSVLGIFLQRLTVRPLGTARSMA